MSQENVEIVRRMNEAFNRGDMDAVAELLDLQIVYFEHGSNVDTPSVLHGRSALLEALGQFMEAFDDLVGDIEELVDAGDRVVTTTHWRGTGAGSGAAADLREVISWKVENGVAVEGRVFADRQEALEAAGLLE